MKNFDLKLSEDLSQNIVERKSIEPLMWPILADYGGVHYLFRFPNDYGASVIKKYGSYGYESDEWELAPIKWTFDNNTDFYLCGEDIFGEEFGMLDDVIGYLDNTDVEKYLIAIKNKEA